MFSFSFSNCFAMEAAIGSGVAAVGGAALGPVAVGVGVVAGGAYVVTHTDEIVQGAKVLMHKMNPDKGGKTVAPRVDCKSKKEAYEKAKRDGKNKEPRLDYRGKHGPHYHPQSGKADKDGRHYYFPKG